jgi:hypothetical protein
VSDNPVVLQFTQQDRDMLRDTNADVKSVLVTLGGANGHEARIASLEKWQTRVVAICSFVGFVMGLAAKAVWK